MTEATGNITLLNVVAQSVTLPDGSTAEFPLDPFARHCLLNGVDELGFLLDQETAIAAYESAREGHTVRPT